MGSSAPGARTGFGDAAGGVLDCEDAKEWNRVSCEAARAFRSETRYWTPRIYTHAWGVGVSVLSSWSML